MTTNQSISVQSSAKMNPTACRALLVGGGVPALIAVEALKELGFDITFAKIDSPPLHFYSSQDVGSEFEDYLRDLSLSVQDAETIDSDAPPAVRLVREGFRATFRDGRESTYDCLFLAPGVSLRPKPQFLPENADLFRGGIELPHAGRIAFLMDHPRLSDPALGMTAIRAATKNVLSGGESVLCFRHAPVIGLLGETLLDDARKAGVQFIRFQEALPPSVSSDPAEPELVRLAVNDALDNESLSEFLCDRLFVVTGPDPSSIPKWAIKMAHGDSDGEGFMLSESLPCNSGCSWSSGVFIVGEATGNQDLATCVVQARAAAAKAKAWITHSRLSGSAEVISTSEACARCLTCLRVCPHQAIPLPQETAISRIEASPALCRECGICASMCPSLAIRLNRWPEETITGFVTATQAADIDQTLFVFGCEKSAGLMSQFIDIPEKIRFFGVPCAGSVSDYVIWSTLAAGAKGVLVVGCHNCNCASHRGTDLAASRVERVLSSGLLGGEPARVRYLTVAANEPAKFERLLRDFLSVLG